MDWQQVRTIIIMLRPFILLGACVGLLAAFFFLWVSLKELLRLNGTGKVWERTEEDGSVKWK